MDVDPTTTLLASGAADNTARLWDVRTGRCIKVWDFNTTAKRVEFSEDGTRLLVVTEQRTGFLGTIVVFDITVDAETEQTSERSLTISPGASKPTVAGWSFLSKYIIAGHEDGSVSQFDAKVLPLLQSSKTLLPHTNKQTNNHPDRRTTRQRRSPRRKHVNHRSPMVA